MSTIPVLAIDWRFLFLIKLSTAGEGIGEEDGSEKDDGVGSQKLLSRALVSPLDSDHPPTATDNVSTANGDWKRHILLL
jgi:hypothetical protein